MSLESRHKTCENVFVTVRILNFAHSIILCYFIKLQKINWFCSLFSTQKYSYFTHSACVKNRLSIKRAASLLLPVLCCTTAITS